MNSIPRILIKPITMLTFALAVVMSAQTRSIDVNEPRPLAVAIDALESLTGTAINYEDPPYENEADLQDVASERDRAAIPGFRLLVPRNGHVSAQLQLADRATENDALVGLTLLIDSYRQNKLPGDFKIEQANGMLYVTPTIVLSEKGIMRPVTSPMMTKVTVPYASRTVADTAQAIFDSVYAATGAKIEIGRFPFWPTDVVSFGANGEVARGALARLFTLAGKGGMSYRLTFDPKPDRMRIFDYMINVKPSGYVPPTSAGQTPEARAPVSSQPSNGRPYTAPAKQ